MATDTTGVTVAREGPFKSEGRETHVPAEDVPLYELLDDIFGDDVPPVMPADLAVEAEDTAEVLEILSDPHRGSIMANDVGYGLSYAQEARAALEDHRDRDATHLVAVGCSGDKYEPDGRVPARELYKSGYWTCKQNYGEDMGQADGDVGWRIISAEHDVLHPDKEIAYYERTPSDHEGIPVQSDDHLPNGDPVETKLDAWARDVYEGLTAWINSVEDQHDPRDVELEILLGRKYRRRLENRGVFSAVSASGDLSVSFPFQEEDACSGGMGNQMSWMNETRKAASGAD